MPLSRSLYRARQFATALLARVEDAEVDEALRLAAMPLDAQRLFRRLPRPYQRHALNVFRRLLRGGARDPLLLQAALLHDIGKWDPSSGRRVGVPYRVAATLLRRVAPGRALLARLGRRQVSVARWRHPFVLQEHHAGLGAALARDAGVAPEVVELIRLHEQPARVAPEHLANRLRELQSADDQE